MMLAVPPLMCEETGEAEGPFWPRISSGLGLMSAKEADTDCSVHFVFVPLS